MAYNVLKGNVQFINSDTGSIESMVDDYSNQTIGGQKTFTAAVTSSAFFVTSSEAGISQIVSSPINTLFDAGEDRVAIFSGSNDLTASTGLTYDSVTLSVTGHVSASLNVSGSEFYGSGVGLSSLPAASITGQVSAANINIGNGLHNNSSTLAVSASNTSITVASTGISINGAGNTSGLVVEGGGLRADPNRADTIASLASGDEFLVADVDDSNNLKKATITQVQTYMDNTLTFAKVAGSDAQIFFNNGGSNTLGADSTFTFNDSTKIVGVSGLTASSNISASAFYGDGNNLTSLNATTLVGNVSAANINIGDGLFNDSAALAVSASFGLKASAQGLEVTSSATSGLDVTQAEGLVISPSRAPTTGTPVTADVILIGDSADSNKVKNTSLTNLTTLVKNNGAGGANTEIQFNNSNAFAGSSALTFNSATNTLNAATLSASVGVHVTGSNPKLAIGDKGGHAPNDGMLFIRPSDTNDRALCLMQGKESDGNRVIFAVTGSGQVIIGGGHFGGVLSISGSTAETLISAKSDTKNPAFQVTGQGDTLVSGSLTVSGSLRAKAIHITSHKFAGSGTNQLYVRFDSNGADTAGGSIPGPNNKLVAPFSGKLIKVVVRATSAPFATSIGFHRNTDGNANVDSTAIETISENINNANTSQTFTFTDAANYGSGDIVGISINPASDPGNVVMTTVWEFDQNS